jgi:hypothetical protein
MVGVKRVEAKKIENESRTPGGKKRGRSRELNQRLPFPNLFRKRFTADLNSSLPSK